MNLRPDEQAHLDNAERCVDCDHLSVFHGGEDEDCGVCDDCRWFESPTLKAWQAERTAERTARAAVFQAPHRISGDEKPVVYLHDDLVIDTWCRSASSLVRPYAPRLHVQCCYEQGHLGSHTDALRRTFWGH